MFFEARMGLKVFFASMSANSFALIPAWPGTQQNLTSTFCRLRFLILSLIFIDREAGEIIHLVASVRLSVCLCVLSCLVLGFAKYSERSSETQVSYILKKHHRVFISSGIQNGCCFDRLRLVAPLQSITLLMVVNFVWELLWLIAWTSGPTL